MKSIGTGLASYGMSGHVFHGPLLKTHKGFRIHSILERTKNESVAGYPEAKIVRDYQSLLTDDEIELIIVNTPDWLHFEMVKEALHAGKHVVAEKPFVLESSQGRELIDLAAAKGLMLSVFQNRRWDGDFLTVKQILHEELLGRVVEFEAHFDRYRNFIQKNTWKELPETGSGTLYNLGSHLIDQALALFGRPDWVDADVRTLRTGGKIDDSFSIMLGYPAVKVCVKASYLTREPGPRYLVHGTLGSYLKYGIDPQEDRLKEGILPDNEGFGSEPASEWGILHTEKDGRIIREPYPTLDGNYSAYYDNIYDVLRKNAKLVVPAEAGNLVIRVIEASIQSEAEGRRISVSSQ